ncbi:MAG: aryl-sulfate sulfotransferase [Haloarculaceae archaeon]
MDRQPTVRMDPTLTLPDTRLGLARVVVVALVVALLVPSGVSALTHDPVDVEPGAISEPADGSTVVSAQGFEARTANASLKSTRLVQVDGEGGFESEYDIDAGRGYFYDVDPLADGTVLVTVGKHNSSFVKYDPGTGQRVWTEQVGTDDTHDVDLVNGDELLVADMRNYDAEADRNDDRVFVYNRTRDAVVWEFRFERVYDRADGGDYTDDWTHVNDVDKVGDGEFMVSPRNMDQVLLVNRSTKEIEWALGEDDNHSTLYEQHNPTYLEGENGTPTVLVADSENDRVVEYARTNGTWERTWVLGVGGNMNWPRDADRLPNGNTLVVDSLNHRAIEVTPTGEVVWEYYVSWGTYDAERMDLGDEPGGPTIREQGMEGRYALNGSAGLTPGTSDRETFAEWTRTAFAGTPLSGPTDWFATRWSHVVPWIRPNWLSPWAFASAVGAVLVGGTWAVGDLVYHRRGARRRLGTGLAWVRTRVEAGEPEPVEDGGDPETADDAGDD